MTTSVTARARDLPQTRIGTHRAHRRECRPGRRRRRPHRRGVEGPDRLHRWAVLDMLAHLAGAAECAVRPVAMARHWGYAGWRAARRPVEFVDHMCASQIRSRKDLSTAELEVDLRRWASQAPEKGAGRPRLVRGIPVPAVAGLPRGARVSNFVDVISIRDVWMHRIDIARAIGRPRRPITVAEPEAVRQVVRDLDIEWTSPAIDLVLTGPGGGAWRVGDGEPIAEITEDAGALMRLLSGRSDECELRFEGSATGSQLLRAARVLF